MATTWSMQGTLLGACSCDWGCPCSFDAPPTQGFCEGGYVWHIERGSFGKVPLDGLTWSWIGHSPGPLHEGNVTWVVLADERATPEQRSALAKIASGKAGGPWTIFMAVAGRRSETKYVPFKVELDGLNSRVQAGMALTMHLGPILNPVTGAAEEIYLDKPTGFTSKRLTLGRSRTFRVWSDVAYDHSGQYGEFSKFDYSGESPD
jgi:hypothetical protein